MLSVIRLNNKMVNRLKKLPYEIRLKRLGIYTQERQRLRGDLIETFKILTGKERIDYKKFLELADATSWLRWHSLKLYKPRCHTGLRQNFFSVRVINEWNKLPQSVIEAPSVNAFKIRLDKYWSDMGDYSWHGYTTHQPQVKVQVPRKHSPDGASPDRGCGHFIAAYYSFIYPERMKGWVGLVGWPTADGLPT